MVLPVTNLGSATKESTSTQYRFHSVRWRQAMPIDRPLAFAGRASKLMVSGFRAANSTAANAATFYAPESTAITACRLKAYERLKSEISSHASIGAALAEFPQALGMIATRASQLLVLAKSIRRLDFNRAADVVRDVWRPNRASTSKSFASNWLEYSFGWRPLIGDIYNAVDVLQSDPPHKEVKASARDYYKTPVTQNITPPNYTRNFGEFIVRCKMGTRVDVTNPNLFLANQLGLVNPATIVWEVIPFSFVVDWFVNVEQFLSQGTDFLGLSLTDGWTSASAKGVVTFESKNAFAADFTGDRHDEWSVTRVSRTLGIIAPGLTVRPWQMPGWGRAANATSVFVQQLRR